jgi:hypothetical protein
MPGDCENMNIRKIIRLSCFILLLSLIPFANTHVEVSNGLIAVDYCRVSSLRIIV